FDLRSRITTHRSLTNWKAEINKQIKVGLPNRNRLQPVLIPNVKTWKSKPKQYLGDDCIDLILKHKRQD
ncbi:hypothetical protein, partial [Neisseria viridiae]